ncbi:hypothetical protein, partial [Streptococcus merionis]|uniref:hypothetical protein n=1 Tax=Streptococcus merionis TaxID=400065 RepID=UPI003514F488
KLKALSPTSIAGGFLVFLFEKNWLEAIIKTDKVGFQIIEIRFCPFLSFRAIPLLQNIALICAY